MNELKFPSSFLWGAATSSHQVEGANTNNDWWAWEQQGKCPSSGLACDQFHLYEKDFDLAKSLHHNAHRFSIEWSRIEPQNGAFDEKAIEHYRSVILALKKRGLTPIVTLHHFTNPQWLAELGGWENPKVVSFFTRYVEKIVTAFREDVTWWVTINEPAVFLFQGYVKGIWPPGVRSIIRAWRVFKHLAQAHQQSYRIIKSLQPQARVGLAHNMIAFTPCRANSFLDRISTKLRNFYFNFRSLQLIQKKCTDFIGVNYYWRDHIHFSVNPFGRVCSLEHHKESGPRNFLNWEVYPQGLYEFLIALRRFNLPILITENGICTDSDQERITFLEGHLEAVNRAIQVGACVIGYLHWSLIDNFEWHHGFRPRFGLVEVNFKTQERHIRPSALKFAEICRSSTLILP